VADADRRHLEAARSSRSSFFRALMPAVKRPVRNEIAAAAGGDLDPHVSAPGSSFCGQAGSPPAERVEIG
jgi:hypothetical protein